LLRILCQWISGREERQFFQAHKPKPMRLPITLWEREVEIEQWQREQEIEQQRVKENLK
jgi:hypothetical protein